MADNGKNRRSSLTLGEKLIFLDGVLLCLVMITTALMGGLFARYVTYGTGSDSARVAKFGELTITETGDFDGTAVKKGMIIPGVDLTKNAAVDFEGSEMSTYVFVEVILSDNWERADNTFSAGSHLSWTMADGWIYHTEDTYNGNKRYIYYQELEPNAVLTAAPIIADGGKITVSPGITKAQITALGNTAISFRASVIQSGGFETAGEAWTALAGK